MENKASVTSLMSCFSRAYHGETEENPIFCDSKAKELISAEEWQTLRASVLGGADFFAPEQAQTLTGEDLLGYLVNTQLAPTPLARAQFCEESLKTAMQTGTQQYVILGAGLDTFAFREPAFTERYGVFEVDHPLTQADKKERIRRAGWDMPRNLRFVPVDFARDDLQKELLRAGFDPAKKTFFSWLGVSFYLSAGQTDRMLESLAGLSAEGSTLLFDYGDEGLFSSPVRRVRNMLAMAAAGGEPMQSCYSYRELERLLEKHRFLIYELLTPQDIQNRYFTPKTDRWIAFEHIGYVTAVFK